MKNRLLLSAALCLLPACAATPDGTNGAVNDAPEGALHVGFLMLDGVYNSELVAPFDIFHHTRFHEKPGMHVFTVGRTRDVVTSFEGLRILPDYDLASAPRIDVLVVPSAEHNMTSDLEDTALIGWVRERGASAQHVLSVCDGAFVLAQAGLLDGHRCTTFPGDIAAFRKRFPHLAVVDDVSFVADGKAITGAGGARSYDPAMYLVEKLYGAEVARGVGRGMVIDWDRELVPQLVTSDAPAKSWMPGDRLDPSITVEDASRKKVRLADIAAAKDCKGIVLFLVAGAEGGDTRKRGGLWCEDSFNDLPLMRHMRLDWADKGIRFIAICCPPVYHESEFGFETGTFLTKADDDDAFQDAHRRFVERTLALRENDVLPFDEIWFDPRFRLLANPARGEPAASLGPRPEWQGRFKWREDTQAYGTPTTWILKPDLTVFGKPFYMNVYESPGRKLRYGAREIGRRLAALTAGKD